MAVLNTNELRNGAKILLDGDPYEIIETDFVKPGKGQGFVRVKIRNLKTGRVNERTFKSGEQVEVADVLELEMQYLYNDGEFYYFMMPDTFEQYSAPAEVVGDSGKWITEQDTCQVILWNDTPIAVEAPNFVVQKIVETDPGVRGDTSSGGSKPATLETGAVVRVPLFIEQGEVIKVDTRKGEYVSRAKE